jgi:hypothetical protein
MKRGTTDLLVENQRYLAAAIPSFSFTILYCKAEFKLRKKGKKRAR